jgi:hypothetical protein
MNGLRSRDSGGKRRSCLVEVPEDIGVLSFSEGAKELAGRQGVFALAFRNPNKDWSFQHNSHQASELAFSDSFVGFHLFASIFGFCQCNDTRNVTRREGLQCPENHRDVVLLIHYLCVR